MHMQLFSRKIVIAWNFLAAAFFLSLCANKLHDGIHEKLMKTVDGNIARKEKVKQKEGIKRNHKFYSFDLLFEIECTPHSCFNCVHSIVDMNFFRGSN